MQARAPLGQIGFLGLSHLGIVSSAAWASFGDPVVAFDPRPDVVQRLSRGDPPVQEPGLTELLGGQRSNLTFSSDPAVLSACEMVVVAQDVPTDAGNVSDLGSVTQLLDAALPHVASDTVFVIMSQVPPGFTRTMRDRLADLRPGVTIEMYYLVETLIFGEAVKRALKPERMIVGCEDPEHPINPRLRKALSRFGCPILPMRYESAELTKTAINLYLIGSVTYANSLSDLCERLGADWLEVVPALRLDQRIGPSAYLRPGLGIAGGNLERDLATLTRLATDVGVDTTYFDALGQHNAHRFDWLHRQLEDRVFARAAMPRIGVWGLAYKKNTQSTKNSPGLRLIQEIGPRAIVSAWDPAVKQADVPVSVAVAPDRDSVLDAAEGLVVAADWDAFATADLDTIRQRMRHALIVDCVGVLASRRKEMVGIEYVSMGR
ncbi:MAG TPA: nucleotide sugar dehydrogenase [Chloroflexota bacterium]|nr:nucleotide sugar dehydrogenase [Chloroflexota bacterium]